MVRNWNTPDNGTHLNYTDIGERDNSLLGWMPLQCRGTLGPITTQQCDLTWLKPLSSPRCPSLVQKKRPCIMVLPPFPGILPASTSYLPPCSPQTLYLQETNSNRAHTLWKNSLPCNLGNLLLAQHFRWKQSKYTSKKQLPFTLPIKKHEVTTISSFSALPTPFPFSESSLGAWFSPYATHWPNDSSFKTLVKKGLFKQISSLPRDTVIFFLKLTSLMLYLWQ